MDCNVIQPNDDLVDHDERSSSLQEKEQVQQEEINLNNENNVEEIQWMDMIWNHLMSKCHDYYQSDGNEHEEGCSDGGWNVRWREDASALWSCWLSHQRCMD